MTALMLIDTKGKGHGQRLEWSSWPPVDNSPEFAPAFTCAWTPEPKALDSTF